MGVYASVAQLDRASDSDSEGRGFESRRVHHVFTPFENVQAAFCIAYSVQQNTRAGRYSADLFGYFYSAYFSRSSQSISSSEI